MVLSILIIVIVTVSTIILLSSSGSPTQPNPPSPSTVPFTTNPWNQTLTIYSEHTTVIYWGIISRTYLSGIFNVTYLPQLVGGQQANITITGWIGNVKPDQDQLIPVSVTLGDTSCYVVRVGMVPNCIQSATFTFYPTWENT